jgi:hypothetical protein
MRLEIGFMLLAGVLVYLFFYRTHAKNLLNGLFQYKKYAQFAGVLFALLCLYLTMKHKPHNAQELFHYANNIIQGLPLNRQTTAMFPALFDLTLPGVLNQTNQQGHTLPGWNPQSPSPSPSPPYPHSGGKATKRSVSETRKKYVASGQGWKCGKCRQALTHLFEVDHIVRLQHGGTNDVDNLVALCPNCHREKTAMENM